MAEEVPPSHILRVGVGDVLKGSVGRQRLFGRRCDLPRCEPRIQTADFRIATYFRNRICASSVEQFDRQLFVNADAKQETWFELLKI